MNKKKMISYSFMLVLMCGIVFASNVNFGTYNSGTTLITDSINADGKYLYGKDVYPTSNQNSNTNCVTKYKSVTKTTCATIKHKTTCTKRVTQVPYQVCTRNPIVAVGCMNPNGQYTNSLLLSNYKYQVEGSNAWSTIPYKPNKILLSGDVIFKLEIPANCKPAYDINNAVTLE